MDSQEPGHTPEDLYAAYKRAEAREQVQWTRYLQWYAKAERQYQDYRRAAAACDHALNEWKQATGQASPVAAGQVTAPAT